MAEEISHAQDLKWDQNYRPLDYPVINPYRILATLLRESGIPITIDAPPQLSKDHPSPGEHKSIRALPDDIFHTLQQIRTDSRFTSITHATAGKTKLIDDIRWGDDKAITQRLRQVCMDTHERIQAKDTALKPEDKLTERFFKHLIANIIAHPQGEPMNAATKEGMRHRWATIQEVEAA